MSILLAIFASKSGCSQDTLPIFILTLKLWQQKNGTSNIIPNMICLHIGFVEINRIDEKLCYHDHDHFTSCFCL